MSKPQPKCQCLAIVPDGNRRYADKRGLHHSMGHTRGLIVCQRMIRTAFKLGVRHVAVWGASETNFERDPKEVAHIVALLKIELRRRLKRSPQQGVGFHLCGMWQRFIDDPELEDLAAEAQQRTANYTEQQLTVLFGYDGATEIEEAYKELARRGEPLTHKRAQQVALTSHLPNVDVYIRTGAEEHPYFSGSFLPFQMQNTQLRFYGKYWPEFTDADLHDAIADRDRWQPKYGRY